MSVRYKFWQKFFQLETQENVVRFARNRKLTNEAMFLKSESDHLANLIANQTELIKSSNEDEHQLNYDHIKTVKQDID